MVRPIMENVDKKTFEKYIKQYPRKLERDVCGICEPPIVSYNDFSLGKWPDSIVAKTYLYDDNPDGYYYEPESKREYAIMVNYKEVLQRSLLAIRDCCENYIDKLICLCYYISARNS